MRILFIDCGSGLGSREGYAGGTVRFYELMRYLHTSTKHSLTIATTIGGRVNMESYLGEVFFNSPRVQVIPIKASLFRKSEPFLYYRAWSYLVSTIHLVMLILFSRLGRYDVAYSPSDFFYSIIPVSLLKCTQQTSKAWAISFHLYPSPRSRPGFLPVNVVMYWLQRLSLWMVAHRYDGCSVMRGASGDAIVEILRGHGCRFTPFVGETGLDLGKILQVPVSRDVFDIIQIGLRASKGIHELPEIMRVVWAACPSVRLGLIGDILPSDRRWLEAQCAPPGAGQLKFLGYVSEEIKYAFLKSEGVVISPSHEEGWGIAITEALACGRSVVGYDLPVYRDVCGEHVETVPCFDVTAFGQTVVRCLQAEKKQSAREARMREMQRYGWSGVLSREVAAMGLE